MQIVSGYQKSNESLGTTCQYNFIFCKYKQHAKQLLNEIMIQSYLHKIYQKISMELLACVNLTKNHNIILYSWMFYKDVIILWLQSNQKLVPVVWTPQTEPQYWIVNLTDHFFWTIQFHPNLRSCAGIITKKEHVNVQYIDVSPIFYWLTAIQNFTKIIKEEKS